MLNEIISVAILAVFVGLLLVGAVTTSLRVLRYRKLGIRRPVLLGRDRDLIVGLAIPFVVILTVRAFGLQEFIGDPEGPHLWYVLLTGLPPIYALARYDFYEIFVIEAFGKGKSEKA